MTVFVIMLLETYAAYQKIFSLSSLSNFLSVVERERRVSEGGLLVVSISQWRRLVVGSWSLRRSRC
jgi:hypothetical protein